MVDGENLDLIEPTEELQAEYEAYCREFLAAEGKRPDVGSALSSCDDLAAGVRACRDHARGANLPPGWVPAQTFWLVRVGDREQRTIIGEMNLRHALTPALERQGGHIGYAVRPSERRRGYATYMLAEGLKTARRLGLRRVLLTCDKRNIASARVIENNGGTLRDEIPSPNPSREATRRYWIEL